MAPRKTNKDTAVKKPVTRKQQKKPLKTPTLLKLKITTPKSDPDSSTPKLTEKQLGVQRKIELANDVALAQLYKNADVIDNVTTTEPEKKKTKKNTKTTPASKTRSRQKRQKTISEFFNESAEAESAVITKQTPKKIIKKTPVPKKRKTEISCPKIKSADSTVCKGRPRKKQKETTPAASRNLRSKKQLKANEAGNVKETRAAAVSSRTNSGASSTPSWTRDISSSSTTTCVTVGDFVRIDQRLPVLQLPDIVASRAQPLTATPTTAPEHTPSSRSGSASSSTSSSSTSSSSSSSSLSPTGSDAASPALESPPVLSQPSADVLNLSISSSERIEKEVAPFDMAALYRQLVEGQKKLDRAFDDFMGKYDEPGSSDTDGGVVQALNDLTFEPIMVECRRVRQILRGEKEEEVEDDVKVDQVVKPTSKEVDYRGLLGPKSGVERNVEGGNYDDDEVSSNDNYTHFDHSPDDEDAISLFAESTFTDCGSSRRDEYVPRPITLPTVARPASARVYKPTPIAVPPPPPPRDVPAPAPTGKPLLLADLYQQKHCTRSAVFHGTCFYYISGGNCKRPKCRYPHIELAVEEVDRRIAALGEVEFIQEYMLVRSTNPLWRLYGLRYLYEAERRELTRLVLEMAIDFTVKVRLSHEGSKQEQVAHEAALTRLSCEEGSVQACADLLRMPVPNTIGNRPLKYLLLDTLSNTANFSRFKRAFIDLAALLVADGSGERLDPGPIVKILERVCILPYEERLVRAMLALVQQTDAGAVPLIPQFKTLVAALPDAPRDVPAPQPPHDDPPPLPPPPALRDDPPTPMTKPIITRTLDFLRMRGYPSSRQFRGQWNWSRGRGGTRSGYPGYQHSTIFKRRPPTHFSNHN